jgi:demethylmenaquinone methyltransferase/2-methoxy-6-polyprenyl-1,4-benzoquinol methylase
VHWRHVAARKLRFFDTFRFLDVATGTADLGIDVARRHPAVSVTGVDLVQGLLDIGCEKLKRLGLSGRMQLVQGNALELPFADRSFDAAGVAFGIRNINDRARALREMMRCVVPGGQVAVLELSNHPHPLVRPFFLIYLNFVIPTMARFFSDNAEAYIYLGKSIARFPRPTEFAALMRSCGLGDVEVIPLTFGVTTLFIGTKPEDA